MPGGRGRCMLISAVRCALVRRPQIKRHPGGAVRIRELLMRLAGAALLCSALTPVHAQESNALSFTTLAITPLAIEGLTTDNAGNLYTTGRATAPTACPVYRIDTHAAAPVT